MYLAMLGHHDLRGAPNNWARLATSTPVKSSSSRMRRGHREGCPLSSVWWAGHRGDHGQMDGDGAFAGRERLQSAGLAGQGGSSRLSR